MKRKIIALALLITMVCSQSFFSFAEDASAEDAPAEDNAAYELLDAGEYEEGELLVVFGKCISDSKIERITENQDAVCEETIEVGDQQKMAKIELNDGGSMEETMEALMKNPAVEYVQPNYRYTVSETDPYLQESSESYQYQFDTCNIFEAWDELEEVQNDKIVKIAVLDTGTDVHHDDLQANLSNTSRYVRFSHGKLLYAAKDRGFHGTHVAGIIGATYDNKKGGSGVASGYNNDVISIIPVGASNDGESLYTSDVVLGINYCIQKKVDIINMSFGGPKDYVLDDALRKAFRAGITLIAASGNECSQAIVSPGSCKEVIAVNAINRSGDRMNWSNFGRWTDISAPGSAILSTVPDNGYRTESGTSMASPVVAGIAALVIKANPDLTPGQIQNILYATARHDSETIFSTYFGYGTIDAKAAVKAAKAANTKVLVDSIRLKDKAIELDRYEYYDLEALIRPATCMRKITWTSSNDNIAKVSDNGRVYAAGTGKCTISAKAGEAVAKAEITVKSAVKPKSIVIDGKDSLSKMVVGQRKSLSAIVLPENATNNSFYFQSSDSSVAELDEEGYIVARSVGKCTLTARTATGNQVDTVEIDVKEKAAKLKITNGWKTYRVGDEFTFRASLTAAGGKATNETARWQPGNSKYIRVGASSGKMKVLKPGETYVKARANISRNIEDRKRIVIGKRKYSSDDFRLRVTKKTRHTVSLKWKKIPIADKYKLYRATKKNGKYKLVATLNDSDSRTYTDKKRKSGKTYYYKVKAVFRNGSSLGNSKKVKVRTKN